PRYLARTRPQEADPAAARRAHQERAGRAPVRAPRLHGAPRGAVELFSNNRAAAIVPQRSTPPPPAGRKRGASLASCSVEREQRDEPSGGLAPTMARFPLEPHAAHYPSNIQRPT